MYARAIEESEAQLGELRRAEWEGFALGMPFLGSALAASQLHPAFALPLFFGGLAGMVLGIRAAYRRWDLLDRLVCERDAYTIPDVRAEALREATPERRHDLAVSVRLMLNEHGSRAADRAASVAEDFEALARELDDDELALDPAAAVACARLLRDPANSLLFDETAYADDVRSRVRQIRTGFNRRHSPA